MKGYTTLEARASDKNAEVVSNVNDTRTGQLMDRLVELDTETRVLTIGKQLVLIERNPRHLDELMQKVLPHFCPQYRMESRHHNMPHYVVFDGQVNTFYNTDPLSEVIMLKGRAKHPDSIDEKEGRKTKLYGRRSEANNRFKSMLGDVLGVEIVVRDMEAVLRAMNRVLRLPFLEMEHIEAHEKVNGYRSYHANMIYNNGVPELNGQEVEFQVTDLASHLRSKKDPAQSHDGIYAAEKLAARRKVGDSQLVIFGGVDDTIRLPAECRKKQVEGALVTRVPNQMRPYVLVLPEA